MFAFPKEWTPPPPQTRPRTTLAATVGALGWFLLLTLAGVGSLTIARHVERVSAHETAILVLERNAAATREVLARHGWTTEAP